MEVGGMEKSVQDSALFDEVVAKYDLSNPKSKREAAKGLRIAGLTKDALAMEESADKEELAFRAIGAKEMAAAAKNKIPFKTITRGETKVTADLLKNNPIFEGLEDDAKLNYAAGVAQVHKDLMARYKMDTLTAIQEAQKLMTGYVQKENFLGIFDSWDSDKFDWEGFQRDYTANRNSVLSLGGYESVEEKEKVETSVSSKISDYLGK